MITLLSKVASGSVEGKKVEVGVVDEREALCIVEFMVC